MLKWKQTTFQFCPLCADSLAILLGAAVAKTAFRRMASTISLASVQCQKKTMLESQFNMENPDLSNMKKAN